MGLGVYGGAMAPPLRKASPGQERNATFRETIGAQSFHARV